MYKAPGKHSSAVRLGGGGGRYGVCVCVCGFASATLRSAKIKVDNTILSGCRAESVNIQQFLTLPFYF